MVEGMGGARPPKYFGLEPPLRATLDIVGLLLLLLDCYLSQHIALQCFDAVGWAAGSASGLQKN